MCGRYTLYSDINTIENHFRVKVEDDIHSANYNIAPGSSRLVISIRGMNERVAKSFKWGFVPSFVTNLTNWKPLINARSETIHEKPSFRKAFQRRRCLVPANGFYEWKDFGSGKKTPFYIRLLEKDLFAMAGIHEGFVDETGAEITTFSIITTKANPLLQPLHERMPAILREENYEEWLNPVHPDLKQLQHLLAPYPTEEMSAYKVPDEVNHTKVNHPGLIAPRLK